MTGVWNGRVYFVVWTVKTRLTATEMTSSRLKILGGSQAWHGDHLGQTTDWVHRWSHECIAELENAVDTAVRRGLRWDQLNRGNFSLKHTAQMLLGVADTLEHGRGVAKLTGLPISDYTRDELKNSVLWRVSVAGSPGVSKQLG